MADARPVFEIQHVSKRFDATQALEDVSLTLYPGEVHALIGENGAGKSTLIKIMTGVHPPDTGTLLIDGTPKRIGNSQEAQSLGIAAIYQEPMVFPDLNVAENIFISHRNRGLFVHWGQLYREAEAILAQLDVHLDVRMPARGLTLAAQQAVEIAKAISLHVRVLIMDEPTASLSAHEVDQLFRIIESLRRQGVAILFIGHRMEEVFYIADRITVLRDGRLISSQLRASAAELPRQREQVIREMVGREVGDFFAKSAVPRGPQLLAVRDFGKTGVFSGVHFEIHQGEVLGFAGLIGARRTDVGLALFGIEPADQGTIELAGNRVRIQSPEQAVRLGIAYVTEDRRGLGLTLPMSIATNITLPTLRRYLSTFGLVRRVEEQQTAEEYRARLMIRTPSVDLEVGKLSGGNQQKVMLSKWLNAQPRLLILDEPTRGIDVRAKAEVHHIVSDLAAQGLAILLISSDLPEVLAMSDRVLVMREGRQMGIFSRSEATQERVMTAAMGQHDPISQAVQP